MTLFDRFPVTLTNSLSGKKELFTPIKPGHVGMYVCGPTVYGDPHLGHARSAITFDIVFRYLKHLGYTVRYVRNITDVGHLENDADEGEDKVAKKAKLEQLEPMEIAQTYTNSYRKAMGKLNVLPPSIEPTATGHIIEQIDVIEKAITNGLAYVVNGSVYFDLKRYIESNHYGELSGKVLDDLQTGSRDTEGLGEKRFPHDFALWKKANPSHIMRWPSPWGDGFPGWHIECTAMSVKYLGLPFDIHGGGMDLQFPHHECEIAQSVGAFGQRPVNYWLHNNMLTIGGQKMAKSLGNFINLAQFFAGDHPLLEQAYTPMTIRFFMLQAHYRSTVDFSNEALKAAEKGFRKLMNAKDILVALDYPDQSATVNDELEENLKRLVADTYINMSDDFNTAKTLAALFEMASRINDFKSGNLALTAVSRETFDRFKAVYIAMLQDVLGLDGEDDQNHELLDNLITVLIELRKKARTDKNYALSDKIRDDLKALGVQLMDGKNGEMSYVIE